MTYCGDCGHPMHWHECGFGADTTPGPCRCRNDVSQFTRATIENGFAASQPPSGDALREARDIVNVMIDRQTLTGAVRLRELLATPAPLDVERLYRVIADTAWDEATSWVGNPEDGIEQHNLRTLAESIARVYAEQPDAPRYPAPLGTDLAGDETSPPHP